MKDAQSDLLKIITQIFKIVEGEAQMGESGVENELLLWKLKIIIKTWFANKVIMFEECLEF